MGLRMNGGSEFGDIPGGMRAGQGVCYGGSMNPEECLMGKHESVGMPYGGSMNRRHMP